MHNLFPCINVYMQGFMIDVNLSDFRRIIYRHKYGNEVPTSKKTVIAGGIPTPRYQYGNAYSEKCQPMYSCHRPDPPIRQSWVRESRRDVDSPLTGCVAS